MFRSWRFEFHVILNIGLPPHSKWLFLGNYVSHGSNQIACICFLLSLKILYPDRIFLLRGKHEINDFNRIYGFYDESILHLPI